MLGLHLLSATAVACVIAADTWAEENRPTMLITTTEQRMEATPLIWSAEQVLLLERNGRMWNLSPKEVREHRPLSQKFKSYTVSEMRDSLVREFGARFQVTHTGHFLVVYPATTYDAWAKRFEELYRSFKHYFAVRGVQLGEPEFPLVAVVCHDRDEFARFSQKEGAAVAPGLLGYYSPSSNRVYLYDQGRGAVSGAWQNTNSTIVHEATHQTAFNLGLHNRFAQQPRWVVEGLGTMFEAPGVWDSKMHPTISDRVNFSRLNDFKSYAKHRRPGTLAEFISSDRLFQTNTLDAYAEAWALSFYLCETQSARYCNYLRRTAIRAAFSQYTPQERLADFTAVFGSDVAMIETHFLRYFQDSK